jgi:hypothetical protein
MTDHITNYNKLQLQSLFDKHGEPETIHDMGEFIKKASGDKLVGLQLELVFSEKVSNSHHSPIGKPQNWSSRNNDLPTSYPGYQGRIWFRAREDHSATGWSHNLVRNGSVAIGHVGTGGYGAYSGPWETIYGIQYRLQRTKLVTPRINCYSYDYRIFVEDFPNLWTQYLSDGLAGEVRHRTCKFSWTDPEILEQDKNTMKLWEEYNTLALLKEHNANTF